MMEDSQQETCQASRVAGLFIAGLISKGKRAAWALNFDKIFTNFFGVPQTKTWERKAGPGGPAWADSASQWIVLSYIFHLIGDSCDFPDEPLAPSQTAANNFCPRRDRLRDHRRQKISPTFGDHRLTNQGGLITP